MEMGLRSVLVFFLIWCGGLTLTVIVMAKMLTLNQRKTQEAVSTHQPTMNPSVLTSPETVQSGKSMSSPVTYIQLIAKSRTSWVLDSDLSGDLSCGYQCPLRSYNGSIQCRQEGLYWLYVHVFFVKQNSTSVVGLKKNAVPGRVMSRDLIKVTVPASQQNVFMMKIVSLQKNDSISISITGRINRQGTYWGMVQIDGTP